MRPFPVALLGLALLALSSFPVKAQEGRPGWIGVALDLPTVDGQIVGDAVVIGQVRRGSPAEEAGLRAGDRLLAIGDLSTPDDFRSLPTRLRIRAGEPVRVRAERDGRRFEVVLHAAERPDDVRSPTVTISTEAESMVERMVREMDSLRMRLSQLGRRNGGPDAAANAAAPAVGSRPRVVNLKSRPGVAPPFEFFVFQSEEYDSLRQAMEQLRQLNDNLRRQEQRRVTELSSSVAQFGNIDVDVELDDELRVVRAALEEVTREAAELRTAMSEAARASAGTAYTIPNWSSRMIVRGPQQAVTAQPPDPEPQPQPVFRPLTPYVLGSNMVAGAQVVDLRPELAQYFGVESGVLIVDIAPGTPAAMAGMVPGDVITRIDQVGVGSVEELRFGISRSAESVPVSLVRQGATREVLLRR